MIDSLVPMATLNVVERTNILLHCLVKIKKINKNLNSYYCICYFNLSSYNNLND